MVHQLTKATAGPGVRSNTVNRKIPQYFASNQWYSSWGCCLASIQLDADWCLGSVLPQQSASCLGLALVLTLRLGLSRLHKNCIGSVCSCKLQYTSFRLRAVRFGNRMPVCSRELYDCFSHHKCLCILRPFAGAPLTFETSLHWLLYCLHLMYIWLTDATTLT